MIFWTATIAAALAVATAAVYFASTWRGGGDAPREDGASAVAEPSASGGAHASVALATSAFATRNYEGAIAFADQILVDDPDHAEARRLRDEARVLLDRFARSIAEGRRALRAGELDLAVQALTVAQSIQPSHADTIALSDDLSQALRTRPAPTDRRARSAERASPPSLEPKSALQNSNSRPAGSPAVPERASDATSVPPPSAESTQATDAAHIPAKRPTPMPGLAPPVVTQPAAYGNAGRTATSAAPRDQPRVESDSEFRPPAASPVKVTGTSPVVDDRAAIRKVVADYERAIETKDLAAFKRVKPNLSADEEGRLRASFRTVASQDIDITVQSVEVTGQQATARIARRDTVEVDGRRQTTESRQTMTFARAGSGWVLVEIAR